MSPTPVHIGIDVACGKGKPLPICVVEGGPRLMPLDLPTDLAALIPKGPGNEAVATDRPFAATAQRVAIALRTIAAERNWRIERVAIDAPALAPVESPRACEDAMGKAKLASFRTPTIDRWPDIIARCRRHLAAGGSAARLPFANMIWMLYGFELYTALRTTLGVEVIETYPAGVIHEIARGCEHKSTEAGYQRQLAVVAGHTGWEDPAHLEARLKETVALTRHDRLDAFMAAWVASLPTDRRRAYGNPADPDDSIWVPRI